MEIKLKLSAEKILDVKFPNVPRGYDPLLVDEYLDDIIKDYQKIESQTLYEEKEVKELLAKNKQLANQIKDLEVELGKYKNRFANIGENDKVTLGNIDLIKRINVLEKFLYQNGYNPNTIK